MPPTYIFFRTGRPRRVHTVVDRLEKELRTFEALGVIVEQTPVRYDVAGRAPGPEFVTLSGGGTLRNGLTFLYVHRLAVRRGPRGEPFVVDESRSYGSVVAGEGVLVRYDSGHDDHKQHPHLASPWDGARGVGPPAIALDREVDLSDFLTAVDDWRADNVWRLPEDPPRWTHYEAADAGHAGGPVWARLERVRWDRKLRTRPCSRTWEEPCVPPVRDTSTRWKNGRCLRGRGK